MKLSLALLVLASLSLGPAWAKSTPVPGPTSSQSVHIGPLGDLSAFSTIVSDTLKSVQSGKSAAAVTRIKAFELLWDKQASALQAKSEAKWTAIDGAADVALGAVRSSTATRATSAAALEALLKLLNAG